MIACDVMKACLFNKFPITYHNTWKFSNNEVEPEPVDNAYEKEPRGTTV